MLGRARVIGTLLMVLTIAGCGDMWGDLWGSKRGAEGTGDGGSCTTATKDNALLTQIILTPPACDSSNTCPCGSYCSSTITGVCVVDCRDDSECASGKTCSVWGQCVGGGSSDGGVPPNPSCPRNLGQILTQACQTGMSCDPTAKRHCSFNDECPYGTRCDNATRLCTYDCADDSGCSSDAGTHVCSCLGACIDPSAPALPPPSTQPVLQVSPDHFTLAGVGDSAPATPNWGASATRDIAISMSAAVLVGTGETPDVFVTAGPNVQVKCPERAEFGSSCQFNLGPLIQAKGRYKTADASVTMQPVPTADGVSPATTWQVRIGANGATGSPRMVGAAYALSAPATVTPPPGAWTSGLVPMGFEGIGTFEFNSPTGEHINIPIAGRRDETFGLVLYDSAKTISESGKFVFQDSRSGYSVEYPAAANDWLAFSGTGHPNALQGLLSSYVSDLQTQVHVLADTTIDGVDATFKMHFRTNDKWSDNNFATDPIAVHVRLHTSSMPGIFCTPSSPCSGGLVCDRHFCSVDAAPIAQNANGDVLSIVGDRSAQGLIDYPIWRSQGDPWEAFCSGPANSDLLPFSGEIDCAGSVIPLVAPLLAERDWAQQTGEKKTASQQLAACLYELGISDPIANRQYGYLFPSQVPSEYTQQRNCVSLGRWSLAATPQSGFPEIAYRAWQQWLEVHSFVAREGLQENEVETVIGRAALASGNDPVPPAPSLDQLQSQMDVGWQWLFSHLWAFRFPDMPYPDYRYHTSGHECAGPTCPNVFRCSSDSDCARGRRCDTSAAWVYSNPASPDNGKGTCVPKGLDQAPDYEQPAGVPVQLLRTMTGHLQVTAKQTQAAAVDAYSMGTPASSRAHALGQAGRTLRFALLVESIAATMQKGLVDEGLCKICNTPQIATRWTAAQNEFKVARDQLLSTIESFLNGGNPLGIRDDDVPLFFGDPKGANSQYFASSDYLIDGWAAPAVTAAQSSMTAARDAWVAHEHDMVQNLQATASRAQYLEQIKQTYGEKIIANCGPILDPIGNLPFSSSDVLDYVATGKVDLSTCFIKPSCIGDDDVNNTNVLQKVIATEFNANVAKSELCKLEYTAQVLASCNNPTELQKKFPELRTGGNAPCGTVPQLERKDPSKQWDWANGLTDIACFLGDTGSRYDVLRACQCLFTPDLEENRTITPDGTAAAPCGPHPGCATSCSKRACYAYIHSTDVTECNKCLGPAYRNLPECDKFHCDPGRKLGCVDQACNYFGPSVIDTDTSSPIQVPPYSLYPDYAFESHPWNQLVLTQGSDGRMYIETPKKRHEAPNVPPTNTTEVCKIPADYLYGAVPDSWGAFKSVADAYPDIWMAATVKCMSGGPLSGANDKLPDRDYPLPMPVMNPSCFSGKMGVAQNQIQGAQLGLAKTRESIEKQTGDLMEQVANCQKLVELSMQQDAKEAEAKFWGQVATGISIAETVASFAFPAAAGADPEIVTMLQGLADSSGGPTAKGVSKGLSTLSSIASSLSSHYQSAADDLEKLFNRTTQLQQCWFQAHSTLRATGGNVTDIKLALNAIDIQRATMKSLIEENRQAMLDGQSKIGIEQWRKYGSYSHDYWFDEKIDRFRKEFEWSRRLTFLAMEAVEYEFQQSLPFRHDILAATSPDQLEDVIRGLKQEQAGRTLNRRRPDESSVVLSLRDDVLKIPDRSAVTTSGERAWTPARRLQGRLNTSAYAYFDKDGNYLGQAVPFSLGPDGILATRCGERLWRVTATIQGDGLSEVAPNAPLLLLKKNTFASQWCRVNGVEPNGLQSGRIYPSENLFQPGVAVTPSDASETTAALMTPWFNIPRSEFFRDSYREGASEELAGRGLYGEYVLLFPKQLLDGGSFSLEKVEDVLVRFDYLSVDNLAQ